MDIIHQDMNTAGFFMTLMLGFIIGVVSILMFEYGAMGVKKYARFRIVEATKGYRSNKIFRVEIKYCFWPIWLGQIISHDFETEDAALQAGTIFINPSITYIQEK
jgi:hypothetical protein